MLISRGVGNADGRWVVTAREVSFPDKTGQPPHHPLAQLFFGCMSLAMLGVKFKGDKRDRYLHHGHPLLKLGLWLLFTMLPFLFPNPVLDAYSKSPRQAPSVSLSGWHSNLGLHDIGHLLRRHPEYEQRTRLDIPPS